MKNPRLPPETPPNSERLRFSVRQMLLATTAIAVYLGLLRWVGPLAYYFAVAVWARLLFMQLNPDTKAAARLAALVLGGVILPLTIMFLSQSPQSKQGSAPGVVHFVGYGIWAAALVVTEVFRSKSALPSAALLCGYLAAAGGILTWVAPAMAAMATMNTDTKPSQEPTVWQIAFMFLQLGGCLAVGWIVAATFFAAAVQCWEKSRRNFLSWLLVFVGMVLAICLPIAVLRLAFS